MQKNTPEKAPLHKAPLIMFVVTTLIVLTVVPWYGLTYGYTWGAFVTAFVLFILTGISITAGYHRLWSHSTYKAHWIARCLFALFGGMALQNSILYWAANHRTHHRHVDDNDKDPYSAKKGFWYSHLGWMIREYPQTLPDYKNVPDLRRDPIVMFQDKYYLLFGIVANILIPMLIGFAIGDVWGCVLIAGFTRIVAVHHVTFFINSWAHMWGSQPYTDENTARDNWLLAIFSFGEGYHNYHHIFQNDYRNGIRWYHFDPSKWLIKSLEKMGLAYDLKKVNSFKIKRQMLEMKFKRLEQRQHLMSDTLKQIIELEYEHFKQTLSEWTHLQSNRCEQSMDSIRKKWQDSIHELEDTLIGQYQRLKVIFKQHDA